MIQLKFASGDGGLDLRKFVEVVCRTPSHFLVLRVRDRDITFTL
jgi:hypothetical protein